MTVRHLLIIDPQNDFCDGPAKGSLAVSGAWNDMVRVAAFIDRKGAELKYITVTLDSHQYMDIGHPAFWRLKDGSVPAPFTIVTADDVRQDVIGPKDSSERVGVIEYLVALEKKGRFSHMIWPFHCLVGTPGHNIHPVLSKALNKWSELTNGTVNYVFKGLNSSTEQYSAIRAEIPAEYDDETKTNQDLIDFLNDADELLVSGEALSHCVKSTIEDYIKYSKKFGYSETVSKIVMLADTMSPVAAVPGGPDYPVIGEAFLKKMKKDGATVTLSTDI